MSITDELRDYVIDADGMGMTHGHAKSIYAIADRIDADAKDNELFRREAEPFCDRLREAAAERADVTLFGVDYVALPLDADGVPIHIGDVMENIVCPSVHREATGVGVECFYGWDEDNARYSQFGAVCYSHRHASTVEDVLDEFFGKANLPDGTQTRAEIIAEYAAKLRLAGDAE